MTVIGRDIRRRIREVLEEHDRPLTIAELQDLTGLELQDLRTALMHLIRAGVVHSTGIGRNSGQVPVYELWSRVAERMRARARVRALRGQREPFAQVGRGWVRAERVA